MVYICSSFLTYLNLAGLLLCLERSKYILAYILYTEVNSEKYISLTLSPEEFEEYFETDLFFLVNLEIIYLKVWSYLNNKQAITVQWYPQIVLILIFKTEDE